MWSKVKGRHLGIGVILFYFILMAAGPAEAQYQAPGTDATSHSICDDCYAVVPLGHSFPFYGETFTTSYMMANGVVMFRNPATYNLQNWPNKGWCCDGMEIANIAASNEQKFSFSIAPFWTDLIQKDSDGGFYSQTSSSSTKYWWHRIEEYRNNNENNISLEIFPSGDYAMEYGDLKVDNHSITIGVMGDLTQDEFTQHEFYAKSNTTNYIYGTAAGNAGTKVYASEGLACAYDPLSSQECDGYDAAFLSQQCDNDSFYSTECDGYQDAFDDLQCDLDPLYSDSCDGYYEAFVEEQLENMDEEEWMTDEDEEAMYGYVDDEEEFGGIDEEDEFFTGLPEEYFMEDEGFDIFATPDIELLLVEEDFLSTPTAESPEVSIIEDLQADIVEEIELNVEEVEEYLEELFEEEELFDELLEEDLFEEIAEDNIIEETDELLLEEDILEEETTETASEPKTSPIATRIAMAQTKNALRISQSAVSMSQESSKGSSDQGQQSQSGENQSGGQNSGPGQILESNQTAQIEQQSASSSSQNNVSMMNQQFFSTDTQLFSDMSGITVETLEQNAEINDMSVETQSEQMQMEIENNLMSTGNPVVGVTIIPVEVVTVQPEQEAPRKSLAEVISEQVAQQKRENSNKVASGQTAAIASLQNNIDLGSYYDSNLADGDFYNVNYIVYENKLDDNARLIYNLSKSNHGTIRKMIRSQYK